MIQELSSGHAMPHFSLNGRYSAWLHRAAGEGVLAKLFRPCERRKYTLDFDSQILFYTVNDGSRNVSLPISFADMRGAALAPQEASKRPTSSSQRNHSKSFMTSTSEETRSYALTPFVLQTRRKRVRLAAEIESDAKLWVEMLSAACLIGQGTPPERPQESGCVLSPEFQYFPMVIRDEEAAVESEAAQPASSKSSSQVSQHSTTLTETSDGEHSKWSEDDSNDDTIGAPGDDATQASPGGAEDPAARPRPLLPTDFGFEGEDVPDSESPEPSPVSTPRGIAAASIEETFQESSSLGPEAAHDGSDGPGEEEARAARARADLMLAHKQTQAAASGRRHRARKADRGTGASGREAARRRTERLAAEVGDGDAESAARIAADLMLVERLSGAAHVPRKLLI